MNSFRLHKNKLTLLCFLFTWHQIALTLPAFAGDDDFLRQKSKLRESYKQAEINRIREERRQEKAAEKQRKLAEREGKLRLSERTHNALIKWGQTESWKQLSKQTRERLTRFITLEQNNFDGISTKVKDSASHIVPSQHVLYFKSTFSNWVHYLENTEAGVSPKIEVDGADLLPSINAEGDLIPEFRAHGAYLAELVFGQKTNTERLSELYQRPNGSNGDQKFLLNDSEVNLSIPYRSAPLSTDRVNEIQPGFENKMALLAHYLHFLDILDAKAQTTKHDLENDDDKYKRKEVMSRMDMDGKTSPSLMRYAQSLLDHETYQMASMAGFIVMASLIYLPFASGFDLNGAQLLAWASLCALAWIFTSLSATIVFWSTKEMASAFNNYVLLKNASAVARQKQFILGFIERGKLLRPDVFETEEMKSFLRKLWSKTGDVNFSYNFLKDMACQLALESNVTTALESAETSSDGHEPPTGIRVDTGPSQSPGADDGDATDSGDEAEIGVTNTTGKKTNP